MQLDGQVKQHFLKDRTDLSLESQMYVIQKGKWDDSQHQLTLITPGVVGDAKWCLRGTDSVPQLAAVVDSLNHWGLLF